MKVKASPHRPARIIVLGAERSGTWPPMRTEVTRRDAGSSDVGARRACGERPGDGRSEPLLRRRCDRPGSGAVDASGRVVHPAAPGRGPRQKPT
jgi:hypothetical protein